MGPSRPRNYHPNMCYFSNAYSADYAREYPAISVTVITFMVSEGIAMATGKITKRTLDSLLANDVTGYLWDDDLKSFGLPTSSSGAASYVVQYRKGGGEPKTRFVLERFGGGRPAGTVGVGPALVITHRLLPWCRAC